jgi:TonB family protein
LGEDGAEYWLNGFSHLGLFGRTSAKCAHCGAALPDLMQAKGDRVDDLMRSSAVNNAAGSRARLCARCSKPLVTAVTAPESGSENKQPAVKPRQLATAVSAAPVTEDSPIQEPLEPFAGEAGKSVSVDDPIEQLRAAFTLPSDILQTEAGRYAMIGIGGAIALLIVLMSIGGEPTPPAEVIPSEVESSEAPPAPRQMPTTPYKPIPTGNPGNWVTTNDYPTRALANGDMGTTAFRLEVSAQGDVTSCKVTQSSGHADLDAATCKAVARRAKFEPAVDYDGQPVASMYSNRVRWQIPVE